MREIKFRAWDDKNKVWLHGYRPGSEGCNICGETIVCGGWMSEVWRDLDAFNATVIEQYTGLKDENGKEIYEGDIMRLTNGRVDFVLFDSGESAFQFRQQDQFYCFSCAESYEVIGNIHENPELLEKR